MLDGNADEKDVSFIWNCDNNSFSFIEILFFFFNYLLVQFTEVDFVDYGNKMFRKNCLKKITKKEHFSLYRFYPPTSIIVTPQACLFSFRSLSPFIHFDFFAVWVTSLGQSVARTDACRVIGDFEIIGAVSAQKVRNIFTFIKPEQIWWCDQIVCFTPLCCIAISFTHDLPPISVICRHFRHLPPFYYLVCLFIYLFF